MKKNVKHDQSLPTFRSGQCAAPLVIAVCAFMALGTATARAEEDHLAGYKINDLNRVVPPANPYTITNQYGTETCDLKKPQFFFEQSAKNGGDDPRGGSAGRFICYKAKCTGSLPPVADRDSQFGVHSLATKKTKLVCLPAHVPVCGDNAKEGTEECDGFDDTACDGNCQPDCSCPTPCPATGGDATACSAYLAGGACQTCCDAEPFCAASCGGAAASACTGGGNDTCSYFINLVCPAECCQ